MLNDGQSSGMDKLLGFLEQDKDVSDLRWAAYMLATVKEECANTWQPIEEYGKGHGSPYGNPVRVTGRDGKTYVNIYYGRGYVQITGEGNYQKMSQRLSLGDRLVIHPERTLDPTAANTQMCIDVDHLNWNDGTPIQLWTCNGGTNQQWGPPGGFSITPAPAAPVISEPLARDSTTDFSSSICKFESAEASSLRLRGMVSCRDVRLSTDRYPLTPYKRARRRRAGCQRRSLTTLEHYCSNAGAGRFQHPPLFCPPIRRHQEKGQAMTLSHPWPEWQNSISVKLSARPALTPLPFPLCGARRNK